MDTILLVVITLIVLAIAVFLIPLLIEAKRAVTTLRKTTEERLNPALDELQINLKNMRNVSENVSLVTEDVKKFSHSVSEAGETVTAVRGLVESMGASTAIKVISLKTAIGVAIEYFLTNLLRKGDTK